MRRLALAGAAVVALAVLLGVVLGRGPAALMPSPLAGRTAPAFALPVLQDPARRVRREDLQGDVALLNVWATWCVSCRQEHEVLLTLAREHGVRILGLNYKDRREDALRWLAKLGDPYVVTGFDEDGRAAQALGVDGAPETYVLDAAGRIAHKHVGPITLDVWRDTLSPLIARLRQRGTG